MCDHLYTIKVEDIFEMTTLVQEAVAHFLIRFRDRSNYGINKQWAKNKNNVVAQTLRPLKKVQPWWIQ